MATLFPLALPPGIYRNGTEYQSKGRWHDCSLVRFYQGTILPVGGWRVKSTTAVTGKARAIIAWNDNGGHTWSAIGTESHLYSMSRGGVLTDITPSGFTAGRASAIAGGGFGSGLFGKGTFGTPRADGSVVVEASMWSLDTFGQYLVGVMSSGAGIIYEWQLNIASDAAAVANAPTAEALFVTQEGMLVALGAAGVPRRVQWSDQRDNTLWAADATNQAGDFDLQTNGKLLQGLRVNGGHMLFTDTDVWSMTYAGDDRVYTFDKVGDGCGSVSRDAAVSIDTQAVWMGTNNFYSYNGYVQALPCDVWDHVFNDINRQQISKVTAEINTKFGEVTWRYSSADSTEINRSVTWNWRENHWRIGAKARLSAIDAGVTQWPMRVGTDGYVYEHEVGWVYDAGDAPYLESGPVEIGVGEDVHMATMLIPDEKTGGDVSATFFIRFGPEGAETSFGPYTLSQYTDVRFTGRQARLRYDAVNNTGWRVGTPRLELTPAGKR